MIMAVFSDIHANLPALEAVLSHLDDLEPDLVLCAGDLVGYGPHPNAVVDLIRSRNITAVRGGFDDDVGCERDTLATREVPYRARQLYEKSLIWTRENMTTDNKTFLRRLPVTVSTTARGRSVVLAHGSPRRLDERIGPDTPLPSLRRMFDQVGAHIMIAGHTHRPMHRVVDGHHLINPGAVGQPWDGTPTACLALIDVGSGVSVRFESVPYDSRTVIEDLEQSGLPPEMGQDYAPLDS